MSLPPQARVCPEKADILIFVKKNCKVKRSSVCSSEHYILTCNLFESVLLHQKLFVAYFSCKKTVWSGKIPKLKSQTQNLYCNVLCHFLFVRIDIIIILLLLLWK